LNQSAARMKVLAICISLLVCGSALDRVTFKTNASAMAEPEVKVEWSDTVPPKETEVEESMSKIDAPIPKSGTAPGGLAMIHKGIENPHTKRRCKQEKVVAIADAYPIHATTHDEATAKSLFEEADYDKDGRLKRNELQKAFGTNEPGCDGNHDWPQLEKLMESAPADEAVDGITFKTFYTALEQNDWAIIGSDETYPPHPQEVVLGETTRPDGEVIFPHMSPSRYGINGGDGKKYSTNTAKSPLTGMSGF